MPGVPFGTNAYRRSNGNFPEIRCVNFLAEAAPTAEGKVALISRWGLTPFSQRGSGPIRAVFSRDGVFDGDVFCISGTQLYRGNSAIGPILGSGPVSYAFSDNELVITRGGNAYSYDGSSLEVIAFPDGAAVRAVAFIAGLFVYLRDGSGKFYWCDLDGDNIPNGREVDPLSFATAESSPDALLDIVVMRGNLYLLGASTLEAWFPNGNPELPFTRIDQRIQARGVMGTGCTVEMDNTIFFIGNDGILYKLGEVPDRVSDHALEERIAGSASKALWAVEYQGHKLVCVRLDGGTWAYDAATEQISEFASHNRANFRARCAVTDGTAVYLGDDSQGMLWTFTDAAQDDGGIMESVFTFGAHIKGGTLTIDNLVIETNAGWTEYLAGQGSNPQAEVRFSRDQAATWGNYRTVELGAQGKYRTRAVLRRCGTFDFPGFVGEARFTDPAPRRVSGVYINEPQGGRSR